MDKKANALCLWFNEGKTGQSEEVSDGIVL